MAPAVDPFSGVFSTFSQGNLTQPPPCSLPRMNTTQIPEFKFCSSSRGAHGAVLGPLPTNFEALPSLSDRQFSFCGQPKGLFPPARFVAPEANCPVTPVQVPCPLEILPDSFTLLGAPTKPQSLEMLKNIEILSTFVVRNGQQFEDMAKRFQSADPNFLFLYGGKPGTDAFLGFEYYQWRKRALADRNWLKGDITEKLQQPQVTDGAATACNAGLYDKLEDLHHTSFDIKLAKEARAHESFSELQSQNVRRNSDNGPEQTGSRLLQQDLVGYSNAREFPLKEKEHALQMSSVTSHMENEWSSRSNSSKVLRPRGIASNTSSSRRNIESGAHSFSRSGFTKANGRTSDIDFQSLSKKRTRGQSRFFSYSLLHSRSCSSMPPSQHQSNKTHLNINPDSEAELHLEGQKFAYVQRCPDKLSLTSSLASIESNNLADLSRSLESWMVPHSAQVAEPDCSFASQFSQLAQQGCTCQDLFLSEQFSPPELSSSSQKMHPAPTSSHHAQYVSDLLRSAIPLSSRMPVNPSIPGQIGSPLKSSLQDSQDFGDKSVLSRPSQPEYITNTMHSFPPEAAESFATSHFSFPIQYAALNQARHELTGFETGSCGLRSTIEAPNFPWTVSESLHKRNFPTLVSPEEHSFTQLCTKNELLGEALLNKPHFSGSSGNCLPPKSQRFPMHESVISTKCTQKTTPLEPMEHLNCAQNGLQTNGTEPDLGLELPNLQSVLVKQHDLSGDVLQGSPPHAELSNNMHFRFSNEHKAPDWNHDSKFQITIQQKFERDLFVHSRKILAPHAIVRREGSDHVAALSNCGAGKNVNDLHCRRLSTAYDAHKKSPIAGPSAMDNFSLVPKEQLGDDFHKLFPFNDSGFGMMDNHSPAEDEKEHRSSHWQSNGKTLAAGDSESNLIDSQVRRSRGKREQKEMKRLRKAVIEYVKSVLKPAWRKGKLSRENFKTIAKKVVNKVLRKLESYQVPRSQDMVKYFMTFSREWISKLVQKYLDKHMKAQFV